MDDGDSRGASAALFEGVMRMESAYIPAFLYLTLGAWFVLSVLFVVFFVYLTRLPDDRIRDYKAKAIENKKRLGIKIYKF